MINAKAKVIAAIKLAAQTGDYIPIENLLGEVNNAIVSWREPDTENPTDYLNFFGSLKDLQAAKNENKYFRHDGWLADVRSHGLYFYVNWYLDDADKIEDCTSMATLVRMKGLIKDSLISAYINREPTVDHAIAVGIQDKTYKTQRYGTVHAYSGTVMIRTNSYTVWKAEGVGSKGNAAVVTEDGFIRFTEIDERV
jgi:hypothetical protein